MLYKATKQELEPPPKQEAKQLPKSQQPRLGVELGTQNLGVKLLSWPPKEPVPNPCLQLMVYGLEYKWESTYMRKGKRGAWMKVAVVDE